MDEVLPIAEAVKIGKEYKEFSESGKMDYNVIRKWLRLLYGKPEDWIAYQIDKAELFAGSKETINYLKEMGCKTIIVTDDALMSLPKCNSVIREKLGADMIIPTAEIEMNGGSIYELGKIRTKSEILKWAVNQYSSRSLLCLVQGPNDSGMALSAKQQGGTVISVNSNSEYLKKVSHHNISTIAEAPQLLERIFMEKLT